MVLLLGSLLALAWRVPIMRMFGEWFADESYYSHGIFVPFVALFFIWRDRHRLLAIQPRASWLGLFIMLSGIGILLLFGMLKIFTFPGFGLILAIWGLSGFLFGRQALRRLAFPAFILTFMIPLPMAIIAGISLKLKLLATEAALVLLNAIGIMSINDGATIVLENNAMVTVGNACSGLRSLISLIFLGLIYAQISGLTRHRKTILFLISAPIALLANVCRVFFLCVVARIWGAEAIPGPVHDISGYMIFLVAFILLYGAGLLLAWRQPRAAEPDDEPPPPSVPGDAMPSAPDKEQLHA